MMRKPLKFRKFLVLKNAQFLGSLQAKALVLKKPRKSFHSYRLSIVTFGRGKDSKTASRQSRNCTSSTRPESVKLGGKLELDMKFLGRRFAWTVVKKDA